MTISAKAGVTRANAGRRPSGKCAHTSTALPAANNIIPGTDDARQVSRPIKPTHSPKAIVTVPAAYTCVRRSIVNASMGNTSMKAQGAGGRPVSVNAQKNNTAEVCETNCTTALQSDAMYKRCLEK